MWIKYRFKTRSIKDYRPLVFNPKYPWWCSGESEETATIIAYLPKEEKLETYWDDAEGIESEEVEEIVFTDRFKRPSWFVESSI